MTGELVDNCQHVSMACCTNLADFCRRVGTGTFRREPEVVFLGPDGRISRLGAGSGPPPFTWPGASCRAGYLGLPDKLARGLGPGPAWRRTAQAAGESFADWLLRHGQTSRTINLYWATVLVSALNERLEQMDVGHAARCSSTGSPQPQGFQLEIPLVPLGELYGARLERGSRERRRGPVDDGGPPIEPDEEGSVTGGPPAGESIAADFVVARRPV